MESEKKIFEMMDKKAAMSKYWMPLVWATNIINRARKDNAITSDHVVQTLLVELSDIRKKLGGLIGYDTVCVPLVYTQVGQCTSSRTYSLFHKFSYSTDNILPGIMYAFFYQISTDYFKWKYVLL